MSYLQQRLEEISQQPKATLRYTNVEVVTRPNGKKVYYYRVGKGRRIRLPDRGRVSDDEFKRAYDLASTGKVPEVKKRGHVAKAYGPAGEPGYVYFVRVGGQVKIGFTKTVSQRIRALQTSCAEPLEVLAILPGTTETEKFMHSRFGDYRTGGEWFSLTGLLADFLGYKIPR